MHVHVVGNGLRGSGCAIRLRGYNRLLAPLMLRGMRMALSPSAPELDELYVARLLEFSRSSSLSQLIILAHEKPYTPNGQIIDNRWSLYVPNDYVLELSRRHPEFLPAISIHPARADAIDELERCAALGAVMMKCLPNCQNIDCNDPRYRSFWNKMAQLKMPLLAHTGGELSLPVVNRAYQNPETLRAPLDAGVTVIAAHAGTASFPFDRDYYPTFEKMCGRYPNLYGDISALSTPFRSNRMRECLALASRMVHGSDLPIPVSAKWVSWRKLISSEQAAQLATISNPLELDYQIKRAIGFPPETFSRILTLLPGRQNSAGAV